MKAADVRRLDELAVALDRLDRKYLELQGDLAAVRRALGTTVTWIGSSPVGVLDPADVQRLLLILPSERQTR